MLNEIENPSDETLIKRAQKGDKESLEILIARYLPLVYSVSRRYLRQTQDAEDATQDTFVKVWRSLKKIDTTKPLKPWIGEITKNTCLDLIKKKRTLPFAAFETEDGHNLLAETIASPAPLPSELTDRSLTKRWIESALAKLPSHSAKILSLYYHKGLNFREISQKINASINTVKSHHRRAIISLRKLLQDPL